MNMRCYVSYIIWIMSIKGTKTIRVSTKTYVLLRKLGTLSDTYDSVIRNLLNLREKGDLNKHESAS